LIRTVGVVARFVKEQRRTEDGCALRPLCSDVLVVAAAIDQNAVSHFSSALCPRKRCLIGIVAAAVNQHGARHRIAAGRTRIVGIEIFSAQVEKNGSVFRMPGISISGNDDLTDRRITIDENAFRPSCQLPCLPYGRFEIVEIPIIAETPELLSRLENLCKIHARRDFKNPWVQILRVRKHVKKSVAIIRQVLSLVFGEFCECLLASRPELLKQVHKLIEVFVQAQSNF
jgi:hypothetical protein